MPTGYTAAIISEEGISFKDFVMDCARAFGACITMRDDPKDKEIPIFEPSDYFSKELAKAEKELIEFKKLSKSDWEQKAKDEFSSAIKRYEEEIKENESQKSKYNKMLEKVREWQQPTFDHKELKSFMIKQINESIDFDCYEPKYPTISNAEEWANKKLKSILWDVSYYTKSNREEIERVVERNKWVKQLKESLQQS